MAPIGLAANRVRLVPRSARTLLTEALLLVVLFAFYKMGRQLTGGGHVAEAMRNAAWLWDLERALPLPSEKTVQSWAMAWGGTAKLANLYYVGVHFPGTALLLIWVFVKHRASYRRVRTELVVLSALGLVVHVFFPLAPPRLSGFGMSDTMLSVGPSAYPTGTDGVANQFAAMPSLHVGWALFVAVAVIRVSRHRMRWLVLAHPAITFAVVVVTANHYYLDGLVAALLLAGTVLACRRIGSRTDARGRPVVVQ